MYFFEGTPLLITFDTDNHVHAITTQTSPTQERIYDVDWVEDAEAHYTHLSGIRPFTNEVRIIGHWLSPENEPLPSYYWSDPDIKIAPSEHCHRITTQELFERLLSKDEQAMWLKNREKTTVTEKDALSVFEYWDEWGNVKIAYCSICGRRFHTESRCIHIKWCDTCDEYSVPNGECPHRSKDDLLYVEPE